MESLIINLTLYVQFGDCRQLCSGGNFKKRYSQPLSIHASRRNAYDQLAENITLLNTNTTNTLTLIPPLSEWRGSSVVLVVVSCSKIVSYSW